MTQQTIVDDEALENAPSEIGELRQIIDEIRHENEKLRMEKDRANLAFAQLHLSHRALTIARDENGARFIKMRDKIWALETENKRLEMRCDQLSYGQACVDDELDKRTILMSAKIKDLEAQLDDEEKANDASQAALETEMQRRMNLVNAMTGIEKGIPLTSPDDELKVARQLQELAIDYREQAIDYERMKADRDSWRNDAMALGWKPV